MAYEIFDDVAFFYLALSVLAVAVIPWSLFKIITGIWEATRSPQLIPLTRIQKLKRAQAASGVGVNANASSSSNADPATVSTLAASGVIQENLVPPKPWFSVSNIVLSVLWVCFILMLLQIPNMSEQKLARYNPLEILGFEEGSKPSDDEVKRAYRKQSLLFHPDRNPSTDAAEKFLLVSKAYESLTSETARKNMEKYGNPDGYKGVSATLGLPSFLAKKENSLRILVVYFFLFIVLPPTLVGMWWRRAKDFVEGGLLKKTIGLWYQFMLPNMGSKPLLELLTIASENEVLLGGEYPTDVFAFKALESEVRPQMLKQRFQNITQFGTYFQYSKKACVILHAYLLRIPIPISMRKDLNYILGNAHKMLGTLQELAIAKGFVRTVFGIFDTMQLITQGLFPHDSPLMQLPHLTSTECRKLQGKGIKTIHHILKSSTERLNKILPDITPQQWSAIKETAELIPDIAMTSSYAVEDEEGLYEGDLVTLKVNLERQSFDADKPETEQNNCNQQQRYRQSNFEGDESTEPSSSSSSSSSSSASEKKEEKIVPAAAAANSKKPQTNKEKFKAAAAAGTGTEESKESGEHDSALSTSSKDNEKIIESSTATVTSSAEVRPMTDDEILDSMPVPKVATKLPDLTASGPSVHSLTFPFPKHEKWTVLLIQKSKKQDLIIGLQKVASFFDEAEVELKFLAPRAKSAKEDGFRPGDENAGNWEYEVHAICDSYVGVDQMHSFTMKVDKAKSVEALAEVAAAKVKEEYKELVDDDELVEEYGPWYYLYFPTFWELLLNMVVLTLLCVFIFNFLHSRGYWQKYIQPITDFFAQFTRPVFDVIYPFLAPLVEPVREYFNVAYQFCSDMLHRDPFPKHPDDVVFDESTITGMGQEE